MAQFSKFVKYFDLCHYNVTCYGMRLVNGNENVIMEIVILCEY